MRWIWKDLLDGIRRLAQRLGHSLLVIGTLALGLSASTAAFTYVNAYHQPFPGISLIALAILLTPIATHGQNVVDLPGTDRALTVAQEEIFTVGAVDGEEWEIFARIHGVAFDAEGHLYILDMGNFRVVKVGPDGGFITAFGRAGGGPGEFVQPMGFSVTRDGEVRVYDVGNQGFSIFNPDGSFKKTARVAGAEFFIPNGGLSSFSDGSMVDGGPGPVGMVVIGPGADPMAPRPVNLLTIADQAEVSTAYDAWNPLSALGAQRERSFAGGGIQMARTALRAFDAGLFVGALPDGRLAVADSTTYTIKLVEPGQGVVRILRRPFTPREVTRKDRNAERERQLAEIAERTGSSSRGGRGYSSGSGGSRSMSINRSIRISSGQAAAILEARVEAMEFGAEIPVIAGMAVDWEGQIWVERTGEQIGGDGPIDLINARGEYVGSVSQGSFEIPDAFGPNGLVAYVERGELDEPLVKVKRFRTGSI